MPRVVKTRVGKPIIDAMMRKGNIFQVRIIDGVPKDAKLIDIHYDSSMMSYYLLYEHPSFEELEDGDVVPEIEVILEKL